MILFLVTLGSVGWQYWNASNWNTSVQCVHGWDKRNLSQPWIEPSERFPDGYLGRFGFFEGNEMPGRHIFRAGAIIEVLRMDTRMLPAKERVELGTAWFFYGPGSGIFINMTTDPVIIEGDAAMSFDHDDMAKAGIRWIVRLNAFPSNPRTEIIMLTGQNDLTRACDTQIPYTCTCIEYYGLATCNPTNMTFRAAPYCAEIHDTNHLLADGLLVLAAVGVGYLLRLCGIKKGFKWLVWGLVTWLPANLIGDSLALLVFISSSSLAAMVTVAFQTGNIPLLFIKKQKLSNSFLRNSITLSYVAGFLSLVMCIVATNSPAIDSTTTLNAIVTGSSVLAGTTGAIGSTSLWAGVKRPKDIRYLSVGMSLGCAVSGVMLLLAWSFEFEPHSYFSGGCMIYVACVVYAGVVSIDNQEEDDNTESHEMLMKGEKSVEKPDDEAPVKPKVSLMTFKRAFFLLYAFNYFVPAIWPFIIDSRLVYTGLIIVLNITDTLGRITKLEALEYIPLTYVLWTVGCTAAVVQMYAPWPSKQIVIGGIALPIIVGTFLRGTLITSIQQDVEDSRESWLVGSYGQLGGVVGSVLSLVLALTT